MYHVLDVCRYVISYCNHKDYLLSNLKLQKLLYFIQAYFLLSQNQPCFKEVIEAWDFGPVVPEAYDEYKMYGAGAIPYVFYDPYAEGEDVIFDYDKEKINLVLDRMALYSSTMLTEATQRQKPWKEAYFPLSCQRKIITNEAIKAYFLSLQMGKETEKEK